MNLSEIYTGKMNPKLTPEAAITSSGLQAIGLVPPMLQGTLAIALNEQLRNVPQDTLALVAVGLLGLSFGINVLTEAKTLMKKGYNANVWSTTIYSGTSDAIKSALAGTALCSVNYTDGLALLASLPSIINGDGFGTIMSSNLIIKSLISTGYCALTNTLLMQNRLNILTDRINPAYERVTNTIWRRGKMR